MSTFSAKNGPKRKTNHKDSFLKTFHKILHLKYHARRTQKKNQKTKNEGEYQVYIHKWSRPTIYLMCNKRLKTYTLKATIYPAATLLLHMP